MLAFLMTMFDSEEERRYFRWLYHRSHEDMERIAMTILGDQALAEDAVQNACCQIIRSFDTVLRLPEERRKYWCVTVAKNEALTLRRKARETLPLEEIGDLGAPPEDTSGYDALVQVFARLPETYRATLEQYFLLELTPEEIAQRLHLTPAAVRMRISRGRKLLQELIRKEGLYP